MKKIILAIILIMGIVIFDTYNNQEHTKNRYYIIDEIKIINNKEKPNKDDIDNIKDYIDQEIQAYSEYYFAKGYLNYINKNYKQAIKNFELTKSNIKQDDDSFLKIYSHVFLNECLLIIEEQDSIDNDSLLENVNKSLQYISLDEEYKNNTDLIWDIISALLNNQSTLSQSTDILESYLLKTRGLTDESRLKLTANLGSLYSFNYKYAQAIYHYLEAIDILDNNKNIEDSNYYKTRIYTYIGDINASLGNHEEAITYYKKATKMKIEDKQKNAEAKSIIYVNKMYSYTQVGRYDKAKEIYDEANKEISDYIGESSKDDFIILMNNNLALVNIYLGNYNEAKELLDKSIELLKNDKVEFTLNKDVYLSMAYAKLYKEQNNYDKAIEIYDYVLNESVKGGLGLELEIYKDISDIYKEQENFDKYVMYNDLYLSRKDLNEVKLKQDHMDYATKLYEYDKLKEKDNIIKTNNTFLLMAITFLAITMIIKLRSVNRLKKSNFTDSMTGLYNRKYLDYCIKKYRKSVIGKDVSVILIDIDYFKKYNDNYGHIKGDDAIKEVSNSIREVVKREGIAIRYGGEEILIILPYKKTKDAKEVANTIKQNIYNKQIEHKHSKISDVLSVSMGIYTCKYLEYTSLYNMINYADKALYKAKDNGRNRFEIY